MADTQVVFDHVTRRERTVLRPIRSDDGSPYRCYPLRILYLGSPLRYLQGKHPQNHSESGLVPCYLQRRVDRSQLIVRFSRWESQWNHRDRNGIVHNSSHGIWIATFLLFPMDNLSCAAKISVRRATAEPIRDKFIGSFGSICRRCFKAVALMLIRSAIEMNSHYIYYISDKFTSIYGLREPLLKMILLYPW